MVPTATWASLNPSCRRTSARVVLLDEDGYVLLFCGSDPAAESDEAPAPAVEPALARAGR